LALELLPHVIVERSADYNAWAFFHNNAREPSALHSALPIDHGAQLG
jgi:hypothetical protein